MGCNRPLFSLSHRGRFFQCDRCRILYKKHPNAGIEPVWVTRTNQSILLSEIKTPHLQNIIGYLFLRTDWRENYRKLLLNELELRLEEEKADVSP